MHIGPARTANVKLNVHLKITHRRMQRFRTANAKLSVYLEGLHVYFKGLRSVSGLQIRSSIFISRSLIIRQLCVSLRKVLTYKYR